MSQDSWPFLDVRRGFEAGIDLNTIPEREYLIISIKYLSKQPER